MERYGWIKRKTGLLRQAILTYLTIDYRDGRTYFFLGDVIVFRGRIR